MVFINSNMNSLFMLLLMLASIPSVVISRNITPNPPLPNADVTVDLGEVGAESVEVKKNSTVKLLCGKLNEYDENSGTTWLKDGVPIDYDESHTITLNSYLMTIYRISERDRGIYGCKVIDSYGNLRVFRNVTVNVIPKSKLPTKASLKMEATSNKFDGMEDPSYPYEDESEYKGTIDGDGTYDDDGGQENKYDDEEEVDQAKQDALDSCKNNATSAKIAANMSYLCFDFGHKKQMTHYLVRPAGTSTKLFCNVKGSPAPKIRWLKNGLPFERTGFQTKIHRNFLQLIDVSVNAGGTYTCEATSGEPEVRALSYSTQLDIADRHGARPVIRKEFENQTLIVGRRLFLNCEFVTDIEQMTTAFFYKTEVPRNLTQFENMITNKEIQDIESRTEDEDLLHNNHLLVFDNVTLADEGWYSCIVGNSIGRSFTSAYISVVEEITKDEILNPLPKRQDLTQYQIAFVTISVALFVLLVICFVICIHNKKQERLRRFEAKNRPTGWTKQVIVDRRPINDEEGAILVPEVNIKNVSLKNGQEYELPIDWSWEFDREKLILGDKLGEGAFGEVLLGRAQDIIPGKGAVSVAVKSLKKTHTDAELIDLISEMETMKVLGQNVNIINLLGCCTAGGELLVIMEYCEQGNLRDYLRNNRNLYVYEKSPTPELVASLRLDEEILRFKDLMSFAFQVARGMEYLVLKKYVHRDLAARNVLVTGRGAGKVVKIADFGMTRSTFTNDYYRKKSDGRVPVKWMAPETLFHRIYTTQSDVWSYGILLWEIVTLGGTPYPTMPDVNHLLDFLRSGQRMAKPDCCPEAVYLMMHYCWCRDPVARPSFSQLAIETEGMLHIAARRAQEEYMEMEDAEEYKPSDSPVVTPPSSAENSACEFFFDESLWKD